MVYEQGDIIEVNFDPTKGHEPQKRRPALVVSDYEFNVRSSLSFVAPITSTINNYPLHVRLSENDAGIEGMVCVEAVRSIDLSARRSKLLGRINPDDMSHVLNLFAPIFGL